MTTSTPTAPTLRSQRRSAFVRGAALTAGLGVTLALAQTVGVPLVLSGSGSRIPNATLQAYNTAGGIAAVLGNTRSGTADAAVVLSQAGTGQFLKAFGPNGGEHEFEIAANGTVSLISPTGQLNVQLNNATGVVTARGFNNRSDRNAKANFRSVDSEEVLDRVTRLPIERWNYRDDQANVQHLGPMAQDFAAAFGLNGGDTLSINTVDAQGVALAAIQGLNARLEERGARIQALERQLAAFTLRLNALERAE
ncbi:tail fiber domain-containing protein [Deinococcus sp. Arct2-2]|uniref:tail fiber domain-containing protein n=1 Tax=Deinococcus sp. Arct2-2 TaxID=2568653 RepID=UPI001454C09C|nr:tail fiber domain-containing protein [Deinococcus sp. Arct2-2]